MEAPLVLEYPCFSSSVVQQSGRVVESQGVVLVVFVALLLPCERTPNFFMLNFARQETLAFLLAADH